MGVFKELEFITEVDHFVTNGVPIPFNPEWKRVGVNVSGGADSAMMCVVLADHIIANNLDMEIHVITHERFWATMPWQTQVAYDVFWALKVLYPNIVKTRTVGFIPEAAEHRYLGNVKGDYSVDALIFADYSRYVAWHEKLDAVYFASTANPPAFNDDDGRNPVRDIIEPDLSQVVHREHRGVRLYSPFRFVTKEWVYANYILRDKLELYNKTRSCVETAERLGLGWSDISECPDLNTLLDTPICGECFWCLERQWAEDNVSAMMERIEKL